MKPNAQPFEGAACETRLNKWISKLINHHNFIILNSITLNNFSINREDKVIALGAITSKALKNIPHFKLPHPSGRNRQINNKEFIDKKLKECKTWIEG